MATAERVRWAGGRLGELAGVVGGAGGRVWRSLEGGVLVGPAAVALFHRVAGRQTEVARAFDDAFGRMEELGRGTVPPVWLVPPSFPRVGRPPIGEPGVGSGSPDGLNDLMIELGRMARTWQDGGRELRGVLIGLGLGGGPGDRVARLGAELLAEQSDLRRRRDLLVRGEGDPLAQAGWLVVALTMMRAVKAADRGLYARLVETGVNPADMPRGGPAEVRDWWYHLTREQRGLYVRAFPALIGWADGLPAVVRDKANRLTLSLRLGELQTRAAEGLTPFEIRDLDRLNRLVDKLASVEKDTGQKIYLLGLSSTLAGPWDRHDRTLPFADSIPRLVTDPTQGPDGRVIIAIGNPDKSQHTGIYVPGTTAQLDNIDGDVERVVNLWKQSQKYARINEVSTVMWLGYDAPDGIIADASRDLYAEAGAPRLRSFASGIRAGQGNLKRHVTVIGHSYGSVVVGEAARQGGFAVDDIVVAGSPGMHVGKAEELGIGAGHVWAQAAEGDPVPNAGRMGHGKTDTGSHWGLRNPVPLVPSDQRFGAQVLATDTHGHSDYWNEGSKSLDNQVRVLTGTYDNSNYLDDPILKAE